MITGEILAKKKIVLELMEQGQICNYSKGKKDKAFPGTKSQLRKARTWAPEKVPQSALEAERKLKFTVLDPQELSSE